MNLPTITLWQPWASLIAEGVKTIETRSWPAPEALVGERIGIHAAAREPRLPDSHGWIGTYNLGRWADEVTHAEPCDCDLDEEELGDRCAKASGAVPALLNDERAHGFSLAFTLPLGAVVATARLVACAPMVAERIDAEHVLISDDELWFAEPAEYEQHETWATETLQAAHRIDDQRPYGDFAPGRWAWLLTDVEKLSEPVPARGRQRIWRWQP